MKIVHPGKGLVLALPLLALCAMIVSGCSSGASYDTKSDAPGLPPMDPKRTDLVTADLKLRVPNVQKSEREIGRILQSSGGYIENASSSDLAAQYPTMTLTLKIPVTKVETAMEGLENLGNPTAMSVSMQDVTDAPAGPSAGSAKPLLSTVNLGLEQSVATEGSHDPEWLGRAFDQAISCATVAYRMVLIGLIWLLAFMPVWLSSVFGYWLYKRRFRRPTVVA